MVVLNLGRIKIEIACDCKMNLKGTVPFGRQVLIRHSSEALLFSRGFLDPGLQLFNPKVRKTNGSSFRLRAATASQELRFGDQVHIVHSESDSLVSCCPQPDFQLKGFPTKLVPDHHPKHSLFVVLPLRSFDRMGQAVREGQPTTIKNVQSCTYLNSFGIDDNGPVYLSTEEPSIWSFEVLPEQLTEIKAHDLVVLRSSLSHGLVVTSEDYDRAAVMKGKLAIEEVDSNLYWQVVRQGSSKLTLREFISGRQLDVREGRVCLALNQHAESLLDFQSDLSDGSVIFLAKDGQFIQESDRSANGTLTAKSERGLHSFYLHKVPQDQSRDLRVFFSAHGLLLNHKDEWERVLELLQNCSREIRPNNCHLFRQTLMFDILVPLLGSLKEAGQLLHRKVTAEICQILKRTLRENKANKRYAHKYLEELLEGAVQEQVVAETVSQIIAYSSSLEIDLPVLQKFIESVKVTQSPNQILLRIIRDICRAEQARPARQELVFRKLFLGQEHVLGLELQGLHPKAHLQWHRSFVIPLASYSRSKPFNFVRQYFYLLSQCTDCNPLARDYLHKAFPLQVLAQAIQFSHQAIAGPLIILLLRAYFGSSRTDWTLSPREQTVLSNVGHRIRRMLEGQIEFQSFKVNSFLFLKMAFQKSASNVSLQSWVEAIFNELANCSADKLIDSDVAADNIRLRTVIHIKTICLDILRLYLRRELNKAVGAVLAHFVSLGEPAFPEFVRLLNPPNPFSSRWPSVLTSLARYRDSALLNDALQCLQLILQFNSAALDQLALTPVVCCPKFIKFEALVRSSLSGSPKNDQVQELARQIEALGADGPGSALVCRVLAKEDLFAWASRAISKEHADTDTVQTLYKVVSLAADRDSRVKQRVVASKLYLQRMEQEGSALLSLCLKDNQHFLFDVRLVSQIVAQVADCLGQKPLSVSKLLGLLSNLMQFKGKIIQQNRAVVIELILAGEYYCFDVADIGALLQERENQEDLVSQKVMAELRRHADWLYFISSSFENNLHCLAICLRKLDYFGMVHLLRKCGQCYFLKAALRQFIRKQFLKEKDSRSVELLFQSMADDMLADLKQSFIRECFQPDSEEKASLDRNVTEIALTVESLCDDRNKSKLFVQMLEGDKSRFLKAVRLCERIYSHGLQCDLLHRALSQCRPELFRSIKRERSKSQQNMSKRLTRSVEQIGNQDKNKEELLRRLKNVDVSQFLRMPLYEASAIPIVMQESEVSSRIRTPAHSQKTSRVIQPPPVSEKSAILDHSFIGLIQRYANSRDFEFALASCMAQVNQGAFKDADFQGLLQTLNRLSLNELTREGVCFVLQRIGNNIFESIPQCSKEVDSWPPEYWFDKREQIAKAQTSLHNFGASQFIVRLIEQEGQHTQSLTVLKQIFLAGISILLGGNSEVQAGFMRLFSSSSENKTLTGLWRIQQGLLARLVRWKEFGCVRESGAEIAAVLGKSFKFMQLLCQNNNNEMKKCLFSQESRPVNFVESTIECLAKLSALPNAEFQHPQLLAYSLQFVNEVAQIPNLEIQQSISQSRLWTFLPQSFGLLRLFLLTLLSLLESDCPRTFQNLRARFPKGLTQRVFQCTLRQVQIESVDQLSEYLARHGRLTALQPLIDLIVIQEKLGLLGEDRHAPYFSVLRPHVRKVEVVIYGSLKQVYYTYHPVFNALSSDSKKRMIYAVTRTTRKEKLASFMEMRGLVAEEIEWGFSHSTRVSRLETYFSLLKWAMGLATIGINLFLLLGYNPRRGQFLRDEVRRPVELLSWLHFSLASLFALLWTRQKIKALRFKLNGRLVRWAELLLLLVEHFPEVKVMALYFLVAGSAFYWQKSLYALLLLGFLLRFQVLESITDAVMANRTQLLVILGSAALLAYNFAFLFFSNYSSDVDEIEDYSEAVCQTAADCFTFLFASGVIGVQTDRIDKLRFFADMLYNVIFQTLLPNIVAAILIDRFAELRSQRERVAAEVQETCFICGLNRKALSKHGHNFEEHVAKRHNLWDYQFYVFSLCRKRFTDYTGIEYYIRDAVERGEVYWLPECCE